MKAENQPLRSLIVVFFFLAGAVACATVPELKVNYRLPPKSEALRGRKVCLVFKDMRTNKDILGNRAQQEFKHFSGNVTLSLARENEAGFKMGAYDVSSLFKKLSFFLIFVGDFLRNLFIYRQVTLRGGNMAVKKDAYLKAGEFDKERTHREDADLSGRLCKMGEITYSLKMCPGFSSRHLKRGGLKYIWEYILNFVFDALKIERKKYRLKIVR